MSHSLTCMGIYGECHGNGVNSLSGSRRHQLETADDKFKTSMRRWFPHSVQLVVKLFATECCRCWILSALKSNWINSLRKNTLKTVKYKDNHLWHDENLCHCALLFSSPGIHYCVASEAEYSLDRCLPWSGTVSCFPNPEQWSLLLVQTLSNPSGAWN